MTNVSPKPVGPWRRRGRLLGLVFASVALSAASCDGGPRNGQLTVRNETDRPVMWLGGSGPLDETVDRLIGSQLVAVIEPDSEAVVSYGQPITGVPDEQRWCAIGEYRVLTSNRDDVGDFERPIDLNAVTVYEHLVDQCWEGRTDEYVIE